jgi:hypothetical protein
MKTIEGRLASNLDAILGEVIAPQRSRFERALLWLRVPEPTARLVAATPVLRWSWFTAVALVLVLAATAGAKQWQPGDQLAVFLALAPLVPVMGIALAYGPHSDRAYEVTVATPLSGLRLILLRTITVVVAAAALSALTVLTAPTHGLLRLAWMLPAFATTTTALAFGAHLGVRRACTGIGLAWLTLVVVVAQANNDATAPFGIAGQLSAIGVTIIGGAALLAGRRRLDRWSES